MLEPGRRLGGFEVLSLLGAGGMGEVYRARDTKLGREVALKILPEILALSPERLDRFSREARLLASLSHPNVATLHDVSEWNGLRFLVMELVEGETLAERIARGVVPVPEALVLFVQLAEGLEAAHRKGIVHRDLKPSNIKITPEGHVKVLDFGLAKALQEEPLPADLSASPTRTRGTESGIILGTAAYMSPEQVRAQEVDARTDIWSFGCVLYQTLTGKPPFLGPTLADTLAAVLEKEPDWRRLPRVTPPLVRSVIRRCLEKNPERRVHDLADARIEIEEVLREPRGEVTVSPPQTPVLWLAIAIVSALVGGFVSWVIQRPPQIRKEVLRLALEASGEAPDVQPLLSPSGERVVYNTPSGLAVRELDKPEARIIPGTAGVDGFFFSPDGNWLGFNDRADGSLKKVSLTGGAPLTLCKGVPSAYGATWGPDDQIVFAPDPYSGLWQVPASGGKPRELTRPDRGRGEKTHRYPHYLPGGKAVLFTVGTSRLTAYDDARIDVLPLSNGVRRTLIEGGTAAAYLESGHLVYRRGASILAAPLDVDRLEVTGTPVVVVDGVQSASVYGAPSFTVARTGMLVYVPQETIAKRLVLVDRAGEARPLTLFVEDLYSPRLSPDGRAIALVRDAANEQVWRLDIARGAFSQVTFEWDNMHPVWTPEGTSLIVTMSPGWKLHRVRADGSGAPEVLSMARGNLQFAGSVTTDGKLLAYSEMGANTKEDIWIVPLEGGGEPRVFLQTPASEGFPALSPDGRFLAYQSDESGQREVYLRSFPDGGSKVQVSAGGGIEPVWARSGKELFYRAPLEGRKRRMMVVDVSPGDPTQVSRGRGLFEDSYDDIGRNAGTPSYDVFPDGQHFVMVEADREASHITHFNVILNWFEELKRLVPPK